MEIVLTFKDGVVVEGLVVAMGSGEMRVLVPGQPDVITLSQQYGSWCADSGDTVEISAVIGIEGLTWSELVSDVAPRTMTADK